MTDKKPTQTTLFGEEPAASSKRKEIVLNADQQALLAELAEAAKELDPAGLLETALLKSHGALVFRLRQAFGSYYRALATLAWEGASPLLETKAALERLVSHYWTGRPLNERYFLEEDPNLGRSLLAEFGSLNEAMKAADLEPSMALADRRLDDDALVERALAVQSRAEGQTLREWEELDPILVEGIKERFGRFSDVFPWLQERMGERAVVYLLWNKKYLARLLAKDVPLVSRGGKGRALLANRYEVAACVAGGRPIWALSAAGILFRATGAQVPLLGDGEFKLTLDRKDRIVALFPEPSAEDFVAIATSQGRVKLISGELFRAFRTEGVRGAALEEGDAVVAGCRVSPDGGDLVVATRSGRGFRIDWKELRAMSRHSRGVLRVRPQDARDQAVALFQVKAEGSYALLSKGAWIRRGEAEELPVRSQRAGGVRAGAAPLVSGAAADDPHLGVLTKSGRLLIFDTDEARIISRTARGSRAIRLDPQDQPIALFGIPQNLG